MAATPTDAVIRDLAATGVLRAAINFGNPVLAQRDPATGDARGVTAELARELASRLSVPLRLVAFEAAREVFEALQAAAWDVAFLAIDPRRAEAIDFTAPYVIIEGGYMVPVDSPLHSVAAVDRAGVRIAVAQGSAYDLHLTRTITRAEIIRAPTGSEAIERFLREPIDVAAGIRGPLLRFAGSHPGLRVIDGRFMVIEQALGVPKGRSAGLLYLRRFLEEMKASGAIADGLVRSGQHDAVVAPAASPD